uniref:Uncharacterized protein n=1 Tax=Anopheles atroparvus TaxID=41427 RepID=A0AAG5D3U4_ANOAO
MAGGGTDRCRATVWPCTRPAQHAADERVATISVVVDVVVASAAAAAVVGIVAAAAAATDDNVVVVVGRQYAGSRAAPARVALAWARPERRAHAQLELLDRVDVALGLGQLGPVRCAALDRHLVEEGPAARATPIRQVQRRQ